MATNSVSLSLCSAIGPCSPNNTVLSQEHLTGKELNIPETVLLPLVPTATSPVLKRPAISVLELDSLRKNGIAQRFTNLLAVKKILHKIPLSRISRNKIWKLAAFPGNRDDPGNYS